MKNNIRAMVKDVIEENAVSFKAQTTKVLYGKVGKKLQEQYNTEAKTIMGKKAEQ